jgi:hypothetical protein
MCHGKVFDKISCFFLKNQIRYKMSLVTRLRIEVDQMNPLLQAIPLKVRRGLWRVYIVITVPWVAFFGVQYLDKLKRHHFYLRDVFSREFWILAVVPLGGPLLFLIIAWIIAGFRDPVPDASAAKPDYEAFLRRAVSKLPENNSEARQQLYERAQAALAGKVGQQQSLTSPEDIAREKKSLGRAIQRLEQQELQVERLQSRKARRGSTVLLAISMFFPGLWATDFTSMSVYWVARPKKETA